MLAAIGNARGWRIRCHTPPNAKSHCINRLALCVGSRLMIAFDQKA
jgi:hypothetical protein